MYAKCTSTCFLFLLVFLIVLKEDELLLASDLKVKSIHHSLEAQEKLDKMKKKRLKRKKAGKLFREILFNSIFLWILYVVSYTNKDVNSFNYKNRISELLLDGFDQVTEIEFLPFWLKCF